MSLKPEQPVFNELVYTYGERIDRKLQRLKNKYPGLSTEKAANIFREEPTCKNSYFGRESNIKFLSYMISRRKEKNWQILSAGCSDGQEPYELSSLLVKDNQNNFKIDAIDVSVKSIEHANKGIFSYDVHNGRGCEKKFFLEMEKSGLLKSGSRYAVANSEFIDYKFDNAVKSKLNFYVSDIIKGPFLKPGQKVYDVIICNNVLYHYPDTTREIIVKNLLENMKSGGILAIENVEHKKFSVDRVLNSVKDVLLEPYFNWKKTLNNFGFRQVEIDATGSIIPTTIYHHKSHGNQGVL